MARKNTAGSPWARKHGVGEFVVVAVAVVEGQRDMTASRRLQRGRQVVARHDVGVPREEAQLAVKLVHCRAPQRGVVGAWHRRTDAVVTEDEHAAPRRDAGQDGPEAGSLDGARGSLTPSHPSPAFMDASDPL